MSAGRGRVRSEGSRIPREGKGCVASWSSGRGRAAPAGRVAGRICGFAVSGGCFAKTWRCATRDARRSSGGPDASRSAEAAARAGRAWSGTGARRRRRPGSWTCAPGGRRRGTRRCRGTSPSFPLPCSWPPRCPASAADPPRPARPRRSTGSPSSSRRRCPRSAVSAGWYPRVTTDVPEPPPGMPPAVSIIIHTPSSERTARDPGRRPGIIPRLLRAFQAVSRIQIIAGTANRCVG